MKLSAAAGGAFGRCFHAAYYSWRQRAGEATSRSVALSRRWSRTPSETWRAETTLVPRILAAVASYRLTAVSSHAGWAKKKGLRHFQSPTNAESSTMPTNQPPVIDSNS
jgi:hypothetical protein